MLRGTVADLSLDGCYVEAVTPLNVHDRVVLVLNINGTEIRTAAEVKTSHPGMGVGLKFRDMAEKDRTGLRSLISRLGYFGLGRLTFRAKGDSRNFREILDEPDESEVFPRVFEKWRNRYNIDPKPSPSSPLVARVLALREPRRPTHSLIAAGRVNATPPRYAKPSIPHWNSVFCIVG